MFEITQSIIEKTEGHILNLPIENKLWSLPTRYIVFPFKYLLLGLNEFFKPASLGAFVAFILMLFSVIGIEKLEIAPEYSILVFNICILGSSILVIFAVPSTYSYYGVNINHINAVVDCIKSEGLDSGEKIELLEQNIEIISQRISSRISFYKWLVGAVWGVYILTFNIEIRVILKMDASKINQVLADNMFWLAIAMLSTIGILLLVVAYKKASDILIKSIAFGCVEYKHTLINEKAPPTHKLNK